MNSLRPIFSTLALLIVVTFTGGLTTARAEHEGKLQVLLLGDSTTEESVPRRHHPAGPHFEDVIRLLLATEKDLPPVNVINLGLSGEFIHGLLTNRYERVVPKLPGVDYIFIRYGLNDNSRRQDFANNFPKDFKELIARLRTNFPQATIIPMTVIPYLSPADSARINGLIKKVAEEEKLMLFDIYPRYAAELEQGPNMLNYRRFPLANIPEKDREWVKPFVHGGTVEVMDNRLDAHFRQLPGWFGDRHPNSAGYHVIADETAKFLAKLIRERKK
jgi:lysophospholipase L1-like esterase